MYYYTNGRPKHEIIKGNDKRITITFSMRKGQDPIKMKLFNDFIDFVNNYFPVSVIKAIKKQGINNFSQDYFLFQKYFSAFSPNVTNSVSRLVCCILL